MELRQTEIKLDYFYQLIIYLQIKIFSTNYPVIMFPVSAKTTLSVKFPLCSSLSKKNPQKLKVLCLTTEAEEENNSPVFLHQCFRFLEGQGMPLAMSVVTCGFEMKFKKYSLEGQLLVNNKNKNFIISFPGCYFETKKHTPMKTYIIILHICMEAVSRQEADSCHSPTQPQLKLGVTK